MLLFFFMRNVKHQFRLDLNTTIGKRDLELITLEQRHKSVKASRLEPFIAKSDHQRSLHLPFKKKGNVRTNHNRYFKCNWNEQLLDTVPVLPLEWTICSYILYKCHANAIRVIVCARERLPALCGLGFSKCLLTKQLVTSKLLPWTFLYFQKKHHINRHRRGHGDLSPSAWFSCWPLPCPVAPI